MYDQLQNLVKKYPNPKALVIFSAHWEEAEWTILDHDKPWFSIWSLQNTIPGRKHSWAEKICSGFSYEAGIQTEKKYETRLRSWCFHTTFNHVSKSKHSCDSNFNSELAGPWITFQDGKGIDRTEKRRFYDNQIRVFSAWRVWIGKFDIKEQRV